MTQLDHGRFRTVHPRRAGLILRLAALGLFGLPLAGCVGVASAGGPSSGAAPGYGYTCYAGVYVCRLPQQIPVGTQCSCPGIGAPSFGRVQ